MSDFLPVLAIEELLSVMMVMTTDPSFHCHNSDHDDDDDDDDDDED